MRKIFSIIMLAAAVFLVTLSAFGVDTSKDTPADKDSTTAVKK